ncbi:MAG: hypothetical protein ACTSP4_08600, partial [Candidatus Hodarchaeales archaeon]
MKIDGNLKKLGIIYSAGGGFAALVLFALVTGLFSPIIIPMVNLWEGAPLIDDTAATFEITKKTITSFSEYDPVLLEYTPKVKSTTILPFLSNVDQQGLSLSSSVIMQLIQRGFAITDEGYENIYDIYADS